MTVKEFLEALEELAPASLAEEWDNCGLQVGALEEEAGDILVALNVTDEVIDEAVDSGCGTILTHHPLIFQPLNAVSDGNEAGRLARRATVAGISVVAAHTNLDAAPGGLADMMADMLGLADVEPLAAPTGSSGHKLVVFVPEADLEPVRQALFKAGAGVIGAYSHCSWHTVGTGTFLPMEGADPAIGEVGTDEAVQELRLEVVVSAAALDAAVAAMKSAHSYEEPAYDIYPLVRRTPGAPAGRVGELAATVPAAELAGRVAALFGLAETRFTEPSGEVLRVAVVPGSGASFIGVLRGVADVLVTGDIKYHDTQQAHEAGVGLIELPHDLSEMAALALWAPALGSRLAPGGAAVRLSQAATSVWKKTASADDGMGTGQDKTERADMADRADKADRTAGYRLHVDGGARGNPGPAGIGAVLLDSQGNSVAELSETIGNATNNVAEYQALIAGLMLAIDKGVSNLDVYSDSELVIRQLQGTYKVKNEGLRPLHRQALEQLDRLEGYRLHSVPREENAHADLLVNRALDGDSR
ncbi:MAG: Nif3-like dinuclear metal center hexameric protein [Gaiellales bacterium]|nr:MAG: Nif3-like dinuclear metal center hexameric protein [Gaiellales bacterium]